MIPKTNFYFSVLFVLICCFSTTAIYAQQCGTQFTDEGGLAGPYLANTDTTYTFCPDTPGDVVTVTFTFVDIETTAGAGTQGGCWDFLSVYNGIGTLDTLQATACGELDGDGGTPSVPESLLQAGDSFISTAADGCLTFTFSSDGSVQGEGWAADVTCAPPPACPAPTSLSIDNITPSSADLAWSSAEATFDIEWGPTGFAPGTGTTVSGVGNPYTLSGLAPSTTYDYYVCAVCDDGAGGIINSDCTGPLTFITTDAPPACGGLFLDSGGLGGIYGASESETTTICPDVVGDVVTVTFTFVDIETTTGAGNQGGCWDFLSVYNGTGTVDTLQMTACGELDGDGGTPSDPTSLLQAGDSFTSTAADGCLTFTFSSDASVQEAGWAADITCAPPAGVSGCTNPCADNFDPTATIDDDSCVLPEAPVIACYEMTTFNDSTCVWDVTGMQPPIDDGCDFTDDTFDDVNCVAVNTPNCPAGTMFDAANCACVTDPIPGCTDPTACNFDPNATVGTDTCVFATGCDVCDGNGGVTDNPEAGDACDDGNPLTDNDTIQADCSCAGVSSEESVPTVSEWGLIILTLLMLITAIVGIRQRSAEEEYHTS